MSSQDTSLRKATRAACTQRGPGGKKEKEKRASLFDRSSWTIWPSLAAYSAGFLFPLTFKLADVTDGRRRAEWYVVCFFQPIKSDIQLCEVSANLVSLTLPQNCFRRCAKGF
jgi:hypothetical protein